MMKSVVLYRILQQHVGKINRIAVQLYKSEIETEEAAGRAEAVIKETSDELNPEPQNP